MTLETNNTTSTISALLIPVHLPGLRWLIAASCITLYLFGYTGCFLSILTFSSKKLRRHSTGFLFLVMALVDILNLFASLQYFLDVIYQINVFAISIFWCRFFTIFNYELYFGFSWIFAFISIDRWIKVEWPTKSQKFCTRTNYIYLCLLSLMISLIQNILYTFLCINAECGQKNLACEIFIHILYISMYMTVPILIILISISRTCLITIHLRKRFRSTNVEKSSVNIPLDPIGRATSTSGTTSRLSNSFVSSISSTTNATTNNCSQLMPAAARLGQLRRRRSRIDTQMVVLISINVAPFILVHIITEIAYLFEKYSQFVAQSYAARLLIIFIYLSWYLISATRFYTNCLLSRIYREEFKNRLYMLRHGCKPHQTATASTTVVSSRRASSRHFIAGSLIHGLESTTCNLTHRQ